MAETTNPEGAEQNGDTHHPRNAAVGTSGPTTPAKIMADPLVKCENGLLVDTADKVSLSTETQTLVNGTRENGVDPVEKDSGPDSKHMVQNQMTPSYPQFTQTGIDEFQQAAAAAVTQSAAVVSDPQAQFKDASAYTQATITTNGVEQQTARPFPTKIVATPKQTDLDNETPTTSQSSTAANNTGPKRLHVSNIPFRFREADLRNLLGFGPILDVEIIFNERGSKGFGFVTFANSADADRAREKLNGTVVEGRKIEVNNATARVMTKKATTTSPTIPPEMAIPAAAALRGVAFTRGRARGAYTAAAAAAAAAAFRHPAPLATAATGLPYTAVLPQADQSSTILRGVYQDPFLGATYAERYQPYAAGYAAAATRYAIPTVATAATYAATGGGAVISSYGREYAADPYLGHSIGPVAGYGAAVYRGGYQRFAPY